MSTNSIQPDVGFYVEAMCAPLKAASTHYRSDDRFQAITSLLDSISAESKQNDVQAGDLGTLGQRLAEVQSSYPSDSNINSSLQFFLALRGVLGGLWSVPVPPAPPPTAAAPTTRLTVFDVAGTSALAVATSGQLGSPTAQTPPAWNLAGLLHNNPLITIEEVPYPGCVPFNPSYQAGVTTLVQMINQTNGHFAMVGTSQGAMVISKVYDKIRYGELASRNHHFLQGITYGNPCRQAGSIAPGCVDPGGHGINVDTFLLSNVDSRWWDFANPGDPAACNGAGPWTVNGFTYDYRGDDGIWLARLFAEMCTNFNGDLAALIRQLMNPPLNIFELVFSLYETLTGVTIGPHQTYGQTMPIAGSQKTCAQLAADRLTAIAASLPAV
jgi:hypothetical protein